MLFRSALIGLLALTLCGSAAAVLNDTGQDSCYDGSGMVACSPANSGDAAANPRQDGRYGRDAATAAGVLQKVGSSGSSGFDFTKIANDGRALVSGASLGGNPDDWACTRDNVTGLVWEVKTSSGLRGMEHTYSWYSSNTASNGGTAGGSNGGTCSGGSGCDSEKFVADVNGIALCGYADWRLPSANELQSLVDYSQPGTTAASIDPIFFPNSKASGYWSADNNARLPANALNIYFNGGLVYSADQKTNGFHVRLVRGGQ